jgi:predicted Zn finger-like uncharacterized protein
VKIQCPQCDTTYDVSDDIANSGAQVQCAKCADVFTATPLAEAEIKAEPEPEVTTPETPVEPEVAAPEIPAEPEVAPEKDPEITLEPIPEPEGDAELLTDEEKDFFSSFGTKIAEEEAKVEEAEKMAEPEPETEPKPEPETIEDDIGWADAEEKTDPEPEMAEETAESDDFAAISSPDDEDLFADAEPEPDAEMEAEPEPEMEEPDEPISKADVVVPIKKTIAGLELKRLPSKIQMGWGALAASLLLLVMGTTFLRVPIVKALPGMAGLYEKMGYNVNIRGLEFYGLSHQWMEKDGRMRLVVRGEIANITDDAVPVPEIIFAMLDGSGHEFFQWTERMKIKQLAPNTRARFRAQIPAPADRVRQLKIRFAKH